MPTAAALAALGNSSSSSGSRAEVKAAVTNRIKEIKGHEYLLFILLLPVVLYYTIGGYA
jgi:hypothetical protein